MPPPRGHQGAVPRDQGGIARNLSSPPPLPPPLPPPPARGRSGADGEAAAPHPPQEGRGTQAGDATTAASAATRQAPPVGGPLTPAVPAADRLLCAGTVGRNGTAAPRIATWRAGRRRSSPPWCPPGEGGGTDRGKETTPPPARLTHRRPTRPRPAPRAARQPRLNVYTQGGCAGEKGGRGPRATPPGLGGREPRRGPPSPLPPTPPPGLRATGAPALHPPRRRGNVPPSPAGTAAPGGGRQLSPHAPRPHAPHRLVPRGSRQAGEPAPAHKKDARTTPGSGTRQRTGAVCGPRPP